MKKQHAIEYIEAVGHSKETAEYMLKDLPEEFALDDEDIPDSVYDTIVDGISEVTNRMFGYTGDE